MYKINKNYCKLCKYSHGWISTIICFKPNESRDFTNQVRRQKEGIRVDMYYATTRKSKK